MAVKEDPAPGVYVKLLHVQQNLKAPKGQYNRFGNFHYRSCEDIQEAVKPVLAQVNAVLTVEDELLQIGERYYVKAVARFTDAESGETVSNVAYARETDQKAGMDAAQITGSCSSYARKYALNGLFCIDDAKDPDASDQSADAGKRQQDAGGGGKKPAAGSRQRGNAPGKYLTPAHISTIRKQIARTGAKEKAVCYQYRIARLEDMTIEQFKNAMEIFSGMPDAPEMSEEAYQMTLDGIGGYEEEMPFR